MAIEGHEQLERMPTLEGSGRRLGVVRQRRGEDPDHRQAGAVGGEQRGGAGRSRGADVDELVRSLRQGARDLDDPGYRGRPTWMVWKLHLGDGRESAIGALAGADHMDLMARHPFIAQSRECVSPAVG